MKKPKKGRMRKMADEEEPEDIERWGEDNSVICPACGFATKRGLYCYVCGRYP